MLLVYVNHVLWWKMHVDTWWLWLVIFQFYASTTENISFNELSSDEFYCLFMNLGQVCTTELF